MIQGILTFQFVLNEGETGEIEPEFKPLKLIFNTKEFTENNYSELIVGIDIFGIFYQHTTGTFVDKSKFSNFYMGRLKNTPYQVISYFKQEIEDNQYLIISIFELDDEIEIFDDLIKAMAKRLDIILEELVKVKNLRQLSLLEKLISRIESELKFFLFQINRLSNLDKLQKTALIFNSEERVKVLSILRECPTSKREMKKILEKIKENPNIDMLLEPFFELNLIRRDWIKGERDSKTGVIKNQGEYLFLIKDIALAQVPNTTLLDHLKKTNNRLYPKYEQKAIQFFSKYDPKKQSFEETKVLANILLNPDMYDNIALMRDKYYPLDKIPNIFSEFADTKKVIEKLKELNIITEIKDDKNRSWVFLLTDIKPLIFFPEYLLSKIWKAYNNKDKDKKIIIEIAKKALNLLEVTFPEKVEF